MDHNDLLRYQNEGLTVWEAYNERIMEDEIHVLKGSKKEIFRGPTRKEELEDYIKKNTKKLDKSQ